MIKTGIDVLITIFCNFLAIFGEKLTFFLQTNVVINILHYVALF
jgi:hypothetical protein